MQTKHLKVTFVSSILTYISSIRKFRWLSLQNTLRIQLLLITGKVQSAIIFGLDYHHSSLTGLPAFMCAPSYSHYQQSSQNGSVKLRLDKLKISAQNFILAPHFFQNLIHSPYDVQ